MTFTKYELAGSSSGIVKSVVPPKTSFRSAWPVWCRFLRPQEEDQWVMSLSSSCFSQKISYITSPSRTFVALSDSICAGVQTPNLLMSSSLEPFSRAALDGLKEWIWSHSIEASFSFFLSALRASPGLPRRHSNVEAEWTDRKYSDEDESSPVLCTPKKVASSAFRNFETCRLWSRTSSPFFSSSVGAVFTRCKSSEVLMTASESQGSKITTTSSTESGATSR
mmetsp:Transcript_22145/g.43921  ORF Transcript_22145/g.43921 Transcript_22145/m.43921 type:complete len:223 (-) Transcript_22145:1337-2005(-)